MSELNQVDTRFADIAQYTRLEDIQARMEAAGIRIIPEEINAAARSLKGVTHPVTCAECELCRCDCSLRCTCARTHRHTP